MRIPLLAANWKMYKTPAEARSFVVTFLETALPTKAEVAIFPPAIEFPPRSTLRKAPPFA